MTVEMTRRNKMCPTCIFRGISAAERAKLAAMPKDNFGCHEEWPVEDIQCRGHFEAARARAKEAGNGR